MRSSWPRTAEPSYMALFGAASSPKNVVAGARFRLIVRLWFHFRTLNAAGLARWSPEPLW